MKHEKHNNAQIRIYRFVRIRTKKTRQKETPQNMKQTQQNKKNNKARTTPQSTHSHLQIRTILHHENRNK